MSMKEMPSGQKVLNPFADDKNKAEASSLESTAGAMDNSTEGECPKCKGQMGTAVAAKSETVYFCSKCRVSSPIPKTVG